MRLAFTSLHLLLYWLYEVVELTETADHHTCGTPRSRKEFFCKTVL